MKRSILFVIISAFLISPNSFAQNENDIIDEVIWVVGDEAILRSEVENMRLDMQLREQRLAGDPYCVIPEQIAIQKLYLHQAKLDSIEVSDSQVIQRVDYQLNLRISQLGSKEKLEEYFSKPLRTIREELIQNIKEGETVRQMKQELVKNVKITPADVRKFYEQIPQDSLPYIPTTVEVQIVTFEPQISLAEIDDIKGRLREYTDLVHSGKMQFSTLARMYSADLASAKDGGELGFQGKGLLAPEFAAVAFDLNDPSRVSRIVETEFGYHIIQLIEKRGDRINVRHILLQAHVSNEEMNEALSKLDSIRTGIVDEKYTFEEAAFYYSFDKDTRNNKGIMVNNNQNNYSERIGTSRFEMAELPQELAKEIEHLNVGDISKPFVMINSKNKKVAVIAKLRSRIEGHKASLSEDFQALKSMTEERKQNDVLNKWLAKKQKETYIRIKDNWRNCDFELNGWVQN
ncbi:peptidylprolyl isomerase [Bacteroidales bacterium OttesenSCG-928-A17]|nr:peptidylprolyl isomerase [Bacteroidales bacterium OttesenSCG-928-A17]